MERILKFRKKPIVIEAVQWNGRNIEELCFWAGRNISTDLLDEWLEIETLEGSMRANKGDWIIKGIAGEFYPCKDEIFRSTYENAE